MNKIIYEYYYIVGCSGFTKWYALRVDKETDKMYYGTAFECDIISSKGNKFAVKKGNLNIVNEITGTNNGLVYRVQVDAEDEYQAEKKAKQIIYNYIIDFAERFKNNKEN